MGTAGSGLATRANSSRVAPGGPCKMAPSGKRTCTSARGAAGVI